MTFNKSVAFLCAILCVSAVSAWDGPTMGWSSWNTYRNHISDKLIRSQAEAMVSSGLKDAGYVYVNIDDGAFDGRQTDGKLKVNSERFPYGLAPVVRHIHSLGLKAGTYSDAGGNTCASFWDNDSGGIGTGLYGHDFEDMSFLLCELGFDFIKVDFCGGDSAQNFDHLDLDEQKRYTQISEAIRSTRGEDVRMNVCRWAYPGTWVADIASSWRISPDINPSWQSIRSIITRNMYLSAYATRGHYNDMDMLEVGRGLTYDEDKTHFGMWCILSSPLLIGCDLTKISPTTKALLSNPELIAINQDSLALQAYVASVSNGCYLFVKDINKLNDTTRAIAVYNPTDTTAIFNVRFADVNIAGKVSVRDVFERCDAGCFSEEFTVQVPAHGTRIFTLQGELRTERTRYEAETAWLQAYQELSDHHSTKSAYYASDANCSGAMKAAGLGMRKENYISWGDIWSKNGGIYTLTIASTTAEPRDLYVEVNGSQPVRLTVNGNISGAVCYSTTRIQLSQGINSIRLFNDTEKMPDIDYIEVNPITDNMGEGR